MTPQTAFVSNINRMLAMMAAQAPVPVEDRICCSSCGTFVDEADAMWITENDALCDECIERKRTIQRHGDASNEDQDR